jgi:hypothetical protein
MKKTLLIAILLGTITTLFAQEQLVYPFKNTIKISPLSFANNTFLMSYEHGFGKNSGVNLSAGIYYYENNNNTSSTTGYLGELQYRYYFLVNQTKNNDKVWNRLFFAPYAFYRQYQVETNYFDYGYNPNNKYTVNTYGGGVILGYHLSLYKFSFEVYAGGGIKLFADDTKTRIMGRFSGDFFNSSHQGIAPKAGLNIGFSF